MPHIYQTQFNNENTKKARAMPKYTFNALGSNTFNAHKFTLMSFSLSLNRLRILYVQYLSEYMFT